MRELFTMWKNTRMIVLTALIAAVYAGVLIPFKAIPLIPGITEIRVAQVLPPVASLLFGPAAAWGIAIGNLIGDMFGSFGPGSLFGFVGNFLLGAIPFLMWGRMGALSSGQEPNLRGGKQVWEFFLVTLVSGIACAFTVAWGLEALGQFPFSVLATVIAVNNVVLPAILGPVLMRLLYDRVKRWGLLWTDLLDEKDIGTGSTGGAAAWLVTVATLVGWVLLLGMSLGLGGHVLNPGFAQFGKGGATSVIVAGIPFMLAMLVSLFLGRARLDMVKSGKKAA